MLIDFKATRLVDRQRWNAASYEPGHGYRRGAFGQAPQPGIQVHSVRQHDGTAVYDAIYTYDSDGLRITPRPDPDSPEACVLFFGDSFILGEGVQDHESIPARVEELSGGRVTAFNFGFHGYGPQSDQDGLLRSMGYSPHITERILPGYFQDSMCYVIPGDGHPSALAHQLLARYLVDSVLLRR